MARQTKKNKKASAETKATDAPKTLKDNIIDAKKKAHEELISDDSRSKKDLSFVDNPKTDVEEVITPEAPTHNFDNFNMHKYEYTHSITGYLKDVDVGDGDLIGAFINDENRGFETWKLFPPTGDKLFMITAYSHELWYMRTFKFKYYSAKENKVYDLRTEILLTKANMIKGTPEVPVIFELD